MTDPTRDFAVAPDEPAPAAGGTTTSTDPLPPTPPTQRTDSNDDGGQSMKEKAAESAQAGKDAAGQVAQTAMDKAKTVAEETQRQVRDLVTEARSQAAHEAARHHRNAATNLHSIGDELDSMARHSEQSGVATELAAQGGQRAHDLANWLDQREPGDLLDEVRTFARRRPGVFLLGALAAGVVAGRLTRGAVAAHRDTDDSESGDLNADTQAPAVPAPAMAEPLPPAVPTPHDPTVGGYRS
jgi:hypothetical protein